jgi:hypothetical protein
LAATALPGIGSPPNEGRAASGAFPSIGLYIGLWIALPYNDCNPLEYGAAGGKPLPNTDGPVDSIAVPCGTV